MMMLNNDDVDNDYDEKRILDCVLTMLPTLCSYTFNIFNLCSCNCAGEIQVALNGTDVVPEGEDQPRCYTFSRSIFGLNLDQDFARKLKDSGNLQHSRLCVHVFLVD